jgi:signal peptidase II
MNTIPDARIKFTKADIFRILMLLFSLLVDQYTKYLARLNFGLPGGEPDYFKVKQVIGEWIQFRLVFNTGAAFGMKPQGFLPFLNPTIFYVIFSTIAIGVLVYYYKHLRLEDAWQKTGVALILSGAFGNLIDRLQFHKVTDFIDVGIPSLPTRWPTFNVADSCVCVGVALIILAPMLFKNATSVATPPSSDAPAAGDNGALGAGS